MTDLPSITTISESRPLAQLTHVCTICGQPIAIGTYYHRIVLRNNDLVDRRHNLRTVRYHAAPGCPKELSNGR